MKFRSKITLGTTLFAISALTNTAFADNATDMLKHTLQSRYPATAFSEVKQSPVSGLYEVIMGRNIAYTDSTGKYMLFGHIFDMANQKDLTADELNSINKVDVSKLPLENAIKTVHGNGKRVMYVFSDPECPFCKRIEPELSKIDNVTIYTFPFPIESLHPGTTEVSKRIWCSKDKSAAWHQMLTTGTLPDNAKNDDCKDPIAANAQLGAKLGVNGTPTLIFANGAIVPGAAPAAEIEKHLDAASASGMVKVKSHSGS